MAIETTVKRSFIFWNVLYIVLCGGFGIWGAYDYWVTIPSKVTAVERYQSLIGERVALGVRGEFYVLLNKQQNRAITEEEREKLQTLTKGFMDAGLTQPPPPLTQEERDRYQEIERILKDDFENKTPESPASYDGFVNFWVYFVGCGLLSTPFFVYRLMSRRGRAWRLDDDGTLTAPEGSFAADRITDIDMSTWMKKSIARVDVDGLDEPIVLDDYEYQDVYLIVGALAHRFHPEAWTEEAKPVAEDGEDEDGDDENRVDEPTEEPTDEPADESSEAPPRD